MWLKYDSRLVVAQTNKLKSELMRKVLYKFRRSQRRKFPKSLLQTTTTRILSLADLAELIVGKKIKLQLKNTLCFVHSL